MFDVGTRVGSWAWQWTAPSCWDTEKYAQAGSPPERTGIPGRWGSQSPRAYARYGWQTTEQDKDIQAPSWRGCK